MNKITKRVMSLMLALVMILGCIPSFTNEVSAENPLGITITFDKNNDSASGTMTDVNLEEDNYTLPVCNFSESLSTSAKIFTGWSFEANGEIIDKEIIEPDDYSSYVNANTLKLYAQWDTLKILEEPSEANNYTFKTNVSNLFGGFPSHGFFMPNAKLKYVWKLVVPHDEIPLDVNKATNRHLAAQWAQNAVYTDANDKYFLIPANCDTEKFSDDLPYTDFSDGIDGFLYNGMMSGNTDQYRIDLIVDTDTICKNDKIKVTFDNYDESMYSDGNGPIETNPFVGNLQYGFTGIGNVPHLYIYLSSTNPFKITNVSILPQDIILEDQTTYLLDRKKLKQEGTYYCIAQFDDYGEPGPIVTSQTFLAEPEITPAPTSHTKKYKANDTKDTAEKISGTGKKGSTRTITPIEGKKVASVIVTDKDGNEIDVTPNEDGTYSFKQPASNVDVQVIYKNREIKLNIGSTKAEVDGEKETLDVCPVIRNDRTMLPIRFIAENLGAKVEWNELEPNMVYITRGDIKIEIKLGTEIMKVNDKEVILDQVAFAENDRTYLPVRAVSEALNAIVEWNEERQEVKIIEQ